ncbi:MAG: hypothetical protein Q8K83_07545 [Methylotenera sp.]|nr:hypothetical protein [Methylotenera sp.]
MASNRPIELNDYIQKTSEQNDLNIAAALEKIEDKKNWESLKPTVSTISKLSHLSRNTIRNRKWALDRLKEIKLKRKNIETQHANEPQISEATVADKLRERIKTVLGQNVLLYEEVLSLQQRIQNLTITIQKKDQEINALNNSRRL